LDLKKVISVSYLIEPSDAINLKGGRRTRDVLNNSAFERVYRRLVLAIPE
jgi:hypothetical protein